MAQIKLIFVQWVLQIKELQIREFYVIRLKVSKMASKVIFNIPLFEPKFEEKIEKSLLISNFAGKPI